MTRIHISADRVRLARARAQLSQRGLAAWLGVSRRTVIRGEQRGMEANYWSDVRRRWAQLKRLEGDTLDRAAKAAIALRIRSSKVSPGWAYRDD
jgi:transcriptional regulator with XRE-family HTH domain